MGGFANCCSKDKNAQQELDLMAPDKRRGPRGKHGSFYNSFAESFLSTPRVNENPNEWEIQDKKHNSEKVIEILGRIPVFIWTGNIVETNENENEQTGA